MTDIGKAVVASTTRPAYANGGTASCATESRATGLPFHAVQRHLVEILGTESSRFLDEKMIDIGAQPMGVGQLVARARGNEQLIGSIRCGSVALSNLCLKYVNPRFNPQTTSGYVRCQVPNAESGRSLGRS